MEKWFVGVIGCLVFSVSTLGENFHTTPGIVVNEGISMDGKVVLLHTYSPYAGYRWAPPGVPLNLGYMLGGSERTIPRYMTPDGNTIVGYGSSENGDSEAFRWTLSGGILGLGDLNGGRFQSDAFGCSDDGGIVFGEGYAWISDNQSMGGVPIFWSDPLTGMVPLGFLDGGDDGGVVTDCSADGTIFVGSDDSEIGHVSYRWITGELHSLGLLQNSAGTLTRENYALACSDDGQKLAGFGYYEEHGHGYGAESIWVWDADTKFNEVAEAWGIPFLTGGPPYFQPNVITTNDLNTIVAEYIHRDGGGVIRWSKDLGANKLQSYGRKIAAWDISGDGRIVVGTSFSNSNDPTAVIWDSNGRIHILEDLLMEEGIDIGDVVLGSAKAVSEDGRTIAGDLDAPFNAPVAYHVTLVGHPLFDEAIGDIWKHSPWYGNYVPFDEFLIFHEEHGWQKFIIGQYGAIYVYDHGLEAWLCLFIDFYPLLYVYGTGEWLEYIPPTEEGGARRFYNIQTGEIIFVPDPGP